MPTTEAEFFAVLDAIKADGTYIPMAMGTNDQWEAATMGYQNIGPNYWKGEEGRLALIKGEQKLTDPQWVAPFTTIAKWKDYLGDGFEAQTYPDSQNLFTLGRAAIYPAGSWEISGFNAPAEFEMGAFPPPVAAAGDTCYISDHVDIAIGLNAASPNAEAAKTFLNWVGSPEFATLYANALPGFFPLSNEPVTLEDPLAQEFVGWREKCESTIRSTYQILSRGTPNLENETWNASANVIRGTETPEAAAQAAAGRPRQLVRAAEVMPPSSDARPAARPATAAAPALSGAELLQTRGAAPMSPTARRPSPGISSCSSRPRCSSTAHHDHAAVRHAEPRAVPHREGVQTSSASTTSAPCSATRAGRRASGTRSATTSGSSSSTCWCRTRSASRSPRCSPPRACASPPSTAPRSSSRPSSPSSSSASSGS